jgi:hypothetical protein
LAAAKPLRSHSRLASLRAAYSACPSAAGPFLPPSAKLLSLPGMLSAMYVTGLLAQRTFSGYAALCRVRPMVCWPRLRSFVNNIVRRYASRSLESDTSPPAVLGRSQSVHSLSPGV